MSGIRSSKLETEKRVFTIQGWIINGLPDYLILKNCQEKFSNKEGDFLSRSQSKKLIQKAYQTWHQSEEASIEEKRSLTISSLKQDVRNMTSEFKNTPQGMAVLLNYKKEINKLEALYPVTRIMLQGNKENPLVITNPEEREVRIAELLAKAQKSI